MRIPRGREFRGRRGWGWGGGGGGEGHQPGVHDPCPRRRLPLRALVAVEESDVLLEELAEFGVREPDLTARVGEVVGGALALKPFEELDVGRVGVVVQLVHDEPHLRGLTAAGQKAPVAGDGPPPALPARAVALGLLDEAVPGEFAQVVTGGAGVQAEAARQDRGGGWAVEGEVLKDLLPPRLRQRLERGEIRDLGTAGLLCHAYTFACAQIPVHWSAPASSGWGYPPPRAGEARFPQLRRVSGGWTKRRGSRTRQRPRSGDRGRVRLRRRVARAPGWRCEPWPRAGGSPLWGCANPGKNLSTSRTGRPRSRPRLPGPGGRL